MSKAIRCDRCNECFDPYTIEGEFGRISNYTIQNNKDFKNNECSYRDEHIDLCPDCLKSFNEWFEKGKIKGSISATPDATPNDLLIKMHNLAENLFSNSQKTQGV